MRSQELVNKYGYCKAHAKWNKANGGGYNHHAWDSGPPHQAESRGDFCYWCGQHKSGDDRSRKPEVQGYSEDDWWNDAIEFDFNMDEQTMIIYIDKEEWYPVYSLRQINPLPSSIRIAADEDTIVKWEKVFKDFDNLQEILDQLYND